MVDEKVEVYNIETVSDEPTKEVVEFTGSDALLEAAKKNPPKILSKRMLHLYLICLIPFLCSTMNGYDGSLLSSLLLLKPFNDQFGATTVGIKAGLISAMYQIGGVATIPFLGPVNDTFGRRFGMFFGCAIVVVGTIIQATSKGIGQFLGGRLVLGFGVSFATAAAPIYAIEISHPSYRAAITGTYNTLYCWGSILATVVLFCTQNITTNRAWIIPTYVQLLCPGIVVIFSWIIPESPRWLYTHGKSEKAKEILTYYHGEGNPENSFITLQIREFEEQLDLDGSDKRWWDYRALFRSKANMYRLGCNLLYSSFGQLSNGGISYFVGAFYHSAGITSNETIFSYNLGTGFLSFVLALIGAQVIQQLGRRKVILGAFAGMTLFWALVTVCVAQFDVTGKTSWAQAGIAFYILFGAVYALGVTPMQALYPTEVLSYEMRAKGGAFSNLVVNAVGLINQLATPVALQNIGWKTYLIWTVWCTVEGIIAYFFFVETKGFTLEELDDIFAAASPRKESVRKRAAALDESHNVIAIDT